MTDEVRKFYAQNNIPIEKIVSVGTSRKNLDAGAIRQAAEILYDEIKGGLEYRPIRLAWMIFAKAKHLKVVKDTEIDDRIAKLEEALAWYKKPLLEIIWKWNRRPVK